MDGPGQTRSSAAVSSAASGGLKLQQKLARQAEQQRKAREKEMAKLLKNAMAEQRKAMRPGHCDKHMTIECDRALMSTDVGTAIVSLAEVSQIGCDFGEHQMRNTIVFKRRNTEFEVDAASGTTKDIMKRVTLTAEALAVVLSSSDFLMLVKSFVEQKKDIVSEEAISLRQYVTRLQEAYGLKPIIIVIGCDSHFKFQLDKGNKQKRSNQHGGQHKAKRSRACDNMVPASDVNVVTRLDVEECCVDLQLKNSVCVIHCGTDAEAAQTVLSLNKSVAEAPFKREKLATLAGEGGVHPAKVRKDRGGLSMVWKKMLQEFRNVSADVAETIAAAYPTPHVLYEAYKRCKSEDEAIALLEDLQVRRGTGALQTMRRVGKELSRRVYELFCTSDPSFTIM